MTLPSRRRLERSHRPLVYIDSLETFAHYVVALMLLVIAAIVLYQSAAHLIENRDRFAVQVTQGINDVLFVVIVLELLRTVVAHLETNDFQLKSFLIVGIISAVRHILGVGARITLTGTSSHTDFVHSQVELGVGAGVVLALALSFLLISRAGVE
ncbi:MAG: phosphate-starvation-inducible PsiE family protein [Gaiellaceae bacterium]